MRHPLSVPAGRLYAGTPRPSWKVRLQRGVGPWNACAHRVPAGVSVLQEMTLTDEQVRREKAQEPVAEAVKPRRRPTRVGWYVVAAGVAAVALLTAFWISRRPAAPTYITAPVTRGTVKRTDSAQLAGANSDLARHATLMSNGERYDLGGRLRGAQSLPVSQLWSSSARWRIGRLSCRLARSEAGSSLRPRSGSSSAITPRARQRG